jgi:xanthine dehydrogenase accessory factor
MICSGEQTIAFYPLSIVINLLINEIAKVLATDKKGVFIANQNGLEFQPKKSLPTKFQFYKEASHTWQLKEDIGQTTELHIIGGGHVGLALSNIAHDLGFSITVYDERDSLNTIEQNSHANCVLVSKYDSIGELIKEANNKYVVLMSFGYQTDKVILKQFLGRKFKYIGMMGSQAKIDRLYKELVEEGFSKKDLQFVHAPIGLQIASTTPKEIAISILAELIQVKNG